MSLLNRWREWRRRRRNPPHVRIAYLGSFTPTPMVCVSVGSATGAQEVYAYPVDGTGDARASLEGDSLAHILQIPLIDRRGCGDFHPDSKEMPNWCLCGRRESEHLKWAI